MYIVYYFLTVLAFIILVILVKTLRFKNTKNIISKSLDCVSLDKERLASKLSKSVQIPTISRSNKEDTDCDVFEAYHSLIAELFPQVHKKLELTKINKYSLLYKWQGTDKNKKPILFTAHMDVVPIEEGTEKDWCEAPFSGQVKDGFVWGRGTLDTKITMIGILEAVEVLLEKGHKPAGDVYLAFGHDEEVGGKEGASKIAEYLEAQGLEFDYVLDEGGAIVEGSVPGVNKPIALVGVGEKGFANIQVCVKAEGGHASMPPKHTSLGYAAQIINNLEKHQRPLKLSKPIEQFLKIIGPEMTGINKVILANMWLFKPLFMLIYSKTKSGNALLRTTTAATMAYGSMEPNVLPQQAAATFNFRITPGESAEELIQHIKKVNRKISMEINPLRLEEPSLISSTNTAGYKAIEKVINALYPDALVAPYIVLAATDAKKYENVCKSIYRFVPIKIASSELTCMHGTNERVSCENIESCTQFFIQMLLL